MAYQINLTGKEIDERLQNIGIDKDVAAADGSLYARISKNADDVDELRDTVGHIDSAQNATDKTVTQHTADISTLQTALKKKANLVLGKVSVNELPVVNSLGNINPGTIPTTVAVVEAINQKLTGLLNWKGVEENISDITDKAPAKKGDVWHANEDGSEWVCTQDITTPDSSAWTELGTPIDLSGYYTKDEVDGKVKPLADSIATKASTTELESIKDKINIFDKKLSSGTLRDLYISAGAKYNEATGYYELNGLTDITEEEMRICYKDSTYLYLATSWRYIAAYSKLRTNIPMKSYARWVLKTDLVMSFEGCGLLEVVNLYTINLEHQLDCSTCASAFRSCGKLRVVKGLDLTHCSTPESVLGVFSGCTSLETIEIFNLAVNISFNDSPLLSKESVIHLISKAKPQSGAAVGSITITLHPTAYARLKDDADIVAALEAKEGIVTLVSA